MGLYGNDELYGILPDESISNARLMKKKKLKIQVFEKFNVSTFCYLKIFFQITKDDVLESDDFLKDDFY